MCACLSFLKMNSLSLLITGRNLSLISSIQHIPSFLFKVKKCSLVNLLLLLVSAITVSELQSGVVIICVGSMGKCTLLLEEIQLFVKVFLHYCLKPHVYHLLKTKTYNKQKSDEHSWVKYTNQSFPSVDGSY